MRTYGGNLLDAMFLASCADRQLKGGGDQISYDPKRLSGVAVYREVERQFYVGDRIQFTAPDKQLGVANRELGMIERIDKDGNIALRLEDGQNIQFKASQHPHFDHGYAVTSHGSQGLTADRVPINIDTAACPQLINSRLAYVSVSRARIDAQIFTDDFSGLGQKLDHDVAKTSAVDFSQSPNHAIPGAGLGLGESV